MDKQINLEEAFQEAVNFHSQGDLRDAEQLYNRILAVYPDSPQVNHNYGLLLSMQLNNVYEGVILLEKAHNLEPNNVQFKNNLVAAQNHVFNLRQETNKQLNKLFNQKEYKKLLILALEIFSKDSGYIDGCNFLAETYAILNDYKSAIFYFKKAIKLESNNYLLYYNLAIMLKENNQLEEAEVNYKKTIQLNSQFTSAYYNLGLLFKEIDKIKEAKDYFLQVTKIDHSHTRAYFELGLLEDTLANEKKALEYYEKALKNDPKFTDAYINLANLLKKTGKIKQAELYYKKALKINPNSSDAYNNLATLFKDISNFQEAEFYYSKALQVNPLCAITNNNFGTLLQITGNVIEAKNYYLKAINLDPLYAHAYKNIGTLIQNMGNKEKAKKYFKKAIDINPNFTDAHRGLSELIKYTEQTSHFHQMITVYNQVNTTEDKYYMGFSLAKAYEDIGDYKKSAQYLFEANKLKNEEINYDINKPKELLKTIKSIFFEPFKPIISHEVNYKKPIFILGMPRSGTTLVEMILSTHSDVYGCGELSYLNNEVQKILHTKRNNSSIKINSFSQKIYDGYMKNIDSLKFNEKHFTDKMPHNFFYIGAILESFPNAKIIHLKRDPMAICWSIFKKYFPATNLGYSFDLNNIGQFYQIYENMMAFWEKKYPNSIYELSYQELTENQENETKKLFEYCELPWEDTLLEPHKNKNSVNTASSLQVREKIYKGSSEAWKNYESFLQPLSDELKNPSCKSLG